MRSCRDSKPSSRQTAYASPINEQRLPTLSWWAAYKGIIDTAISKNMKGHHSATGYKPGVGTVSDMTAFYAMWQAVVDAYGTKRPRLFRRHKRTLRIQSDCVYSTSSSNGWRNTRAFPRIGLSWPETTTDQDVNQQGADPRSSRVPVVSSTCTTSPPPPQRNKGGGTSSSRRSAPTTTAPSRTEWGVVMTTGIDLPDFSSQLTEPSGGSADPSDGCAGYSLRWLTQHQHSPT